MTIEIESLRFQCIIGILDFERESPQDVIVDIEIAYHYSNDAFLDYALVVECVKKDMIEKKYLLIEDAIKHLSVLLKKTFFHITQLKIKIAKPSILPDCKVSVADSFSFDS